MGGISEPLHLSDPLNKARADALLEKSCKGCFSPVIQFHSPSQFSPTMYQFIISFTTVSSIKPF